MTYPLSTPLAEAIARAEAAGACAAEIHRLRALDAPGVTLADLLDHPSAAWWAYWYARDVIKTRWPEAEATIMTDPEWAYWYASGVIKTRWPEAEATIATDPRWAYWYARDVIKTRWPEAEATIATDSKWACWYARDVPGVLSDWREAVQ